MLEKLYGRMQKNEIVDHYIMPHTKFKWIERMMTWNQSLEGNIGSKLITSVVLKSYFGFDNKERSWSTNWKATAWQKKPSTDEKMQPIWNGRKCLVKSGHIKWLIKYHLQKYSQIIKLKVGREMKRQFSKATCEWLTDIWKHVQHYE